MYKLSDIGINIEILGQPDKEHFGFIRGDKDRLRLNRQLGFIWDYTPSLWDKFTSIDEYFSFVANKIQQDPTYRRVITVRAMNIQNILGR